MKSQSSKTSKDDQGNRLKILNAAEMLFARDGFDATSLRAITAEVGVNIALVNYYFRSKDRLIVEVLSRALRPLNEERLRLLRDAVDQAKPKAVSLHKILEAMIRPCLELAFDSSKQQVGQLLMRSLSEAENFIQEVIEKEWLPADVHLVEAFQKTLPHVPLEQIYWRKLFTAGVLLKVFTCRKDMEVISKGVCRWEFDHVLNQIIAYAAAGMQAPVTLE